MLSDYHDLAHEHPEHKDKIHTLKSSNTRFLKLFNDYHDLNKDILRIEKEIEAASDERLEDMKKHRLSLKDDLMEMLVS